MEKYEGVCLYTQKKTLSWSSRVLRKTGIPIPDHTASQSKKQQYFNLLWSDVTDIKFRFKQLEAEDSNKTTGNRRHIRTSKPMTRSWAGHLLSMASEEFVIRLDRKT